MHQLRYFKGSMILLAFFKLLQRLPCSLPSSHSLNTLLFVYLNIGGAISVSIEVFTSFRICSLSLHCNSCFVLPSLYFFCEQLYLLSCFVILCIFGDYCIAFPPLPFIRAIAKDSLLPLCLSHPQYQRIRTFKGKSTRG